MSLFYYTLPPFVKKWPTFGPPGWKPPGQQRGSRSAKPLARCPSWSGDCSDGLHPIAGSALPSQQQPSLTDQTPDQGRPLSLAPALIGAAILPPSLHRGPVSPSSCSLGRLPRSGAGDLAELQLKPPSAGSAFEKALPTGSPANKTSRPSPLLDRGLLSCSSRLCPSRVLHRAPFLPVPRP